MWIHEYIKNKINQCPCGDPIPHMLDAHTDLDVAIATANEAARLAKEAATTAAAWMQVVRRLARRGAR